jgi:SAM-dependent methyltransferase
VEEPAEVTAFAGLLTPEGRRLLARLPPYDPTAVLAVTETLRRDGFGDDLVAAALTQSRLRGRARAKLGDLAGRLFLTEDGLQQATRPAVAERHAQRYVAAGAVEVLDLCCGIGADLLAFAGAGLRVTGVDRDPLTCAVARANLGELGLGAQGEVRCADVLDVDLDGVAALFVDPARRTGTGRTFDPRAYSPPFDAVLAMAHRVPASGAKLAPGIAHAVLPAGTEAEWVSDGGDVVECALWFGPLAGRAPRRATLLPSGATVTGDGTQRAPVRPVRTWLHEPDGAVIRAGLVAEVAGPVGGTLIDPSIAYFTTDSEVASPFTSAYEVLEVLPFGVKRLRSLLRARGVGRLTVKKRGSAVEPEALRRQLRLTGDEEATVVLTRVAGAPTVLLVEPVLTGRRGRPGR